MPVAHRSASRCGTARATKAPPRAHLMLTWFIMHPDRAAPPENTELVFPPALVRVLRERLASDRCFDKVADEIIVQLLTTIFFAGLETYEGERNPIGVAFLGKSQSEFIMP